MFKTIDEFLTIWKSESESTMKIFNDLTQESLNQHVNEGGRTLGYIAWHISDTIVQMIPDTGLELTSMKKNEEHGEDLNLIRSLYKAVSDELAVKIKENWTDAMLEDELELWGRKWIRSEVLKDIILHQIHHRAQMTVLMRQAGLKVPGIYGPSKEEWEEYGMNVPK